MKTQDEITQSAIEEVEAMLGFEIAFLEIRIAPDLEATLSIGEISSMIKSVS